MIIMKYKLGVFGSVVDETEKTRRIARQLGKEISTFSKSVILINGACPGIPYEVARAARTAGSIEIWGFSSEVSEEKQRQYNPKDNLSLYSKLIYVRGDFELVDNEVARKKFRNVLSTARCDAGIIVSGRWGSMEEFTNLYDMGKVVGVLTGTGGVADILPEIFPKVHKPSKARVFFDNAPGKLVQLVIEEVKRRNL